MAVEYKMCIYTPTAQVIVTKTSHVQFVFWFFFFFSFGHTKWMAFHLARCERARLRFYRECWFLSTKLLEETRAPATPIEREWNAWSQLTKHSKRQNTWWTAKNTSRKIPWKLKHCYFFPLVDEYFFSLAFSILTLASTSTSSHCKNGSFCMVLLLLLLLRLDFV